MSDSENTVPKSSSEAIASSLMTTTTTMFGDTQQPVFSLTPTNPLLASTQWSPWAFNPLLSLQAQQAAYMLGAAGAGNLQALLGQLNQAGQIKHRSLPAIPIAGPAFTGQIEHRSSAASINAGPVNATEGSHEMDSASEHPPVEDRPIFQPGSKRRRRMDTESDDKEEDEDQELQAEMFDPDSFYKHSKKLKLPQSIEHYVNTHFHSCLSNSVRKAMAADNPLPNIPALTAPIADHVIVDYMGGAFPTKPDTQLKCLQSTVIAAAAPILNL